MTLAGMFERAGVSPRSLRGDAEIARAFIDSRACVPGSLFVCMPGGTQDPHTFIPSALANGTVACVVFDAGALEAHPQVPMALLDASEYEDALWRLMDALYDHPSRAMTLVGITGTNGKTTTAWLVRQLFTLLGKRAGYLGTLGFSLDGQPDRELNNTTPFCVETYDLVAQARDAGIEALAMEVSSHALAQKRVDGLEFDVAVFTNLTQDHLDFHGSMEAYRDAKFRLFQELPGLSTKKASFVLNADELVIARELSIMGDEPMLWFSRTDLCEPLTIENLHVGVAEIGGEITDPVGGRSAFVAPLGGDYNVENLIAAVGAVIATGGQLAEIAPLLARLRPVPGRFEPVANGRGIGILVDYAHTPDALEKVLDTAKSLTPGRLIAVFGCGGDRDRTKRPKMARAASERADLTVVTSDNPRTEDPQSILDEVLTGIVPGRESVDIIDRREAVSYAIRVAKPGDTVVIAGKGHEDYQIIGRTKHPMDDRELAREALAAL